MGATTVSSKPGLASASGVRRLVIVADNSLIVEAVRLSLRRTGEFNFVGHADGHRTSASTIIGARPDVVLLDEMGRSERTIELVKEISAADARIALIVLGVHIDDAWLARIFGAGATAAISKAAQPAALATLVRETLNGHIVHRFAQPQAPAAHAPFAVGGEDSPLTRRELEILELVAAGATNGDVARRLWVTEQTVKFHLRNIYRKLDVANRTEASHFAHVNGLVGLRAGHAAPNRRAPLAGVD